MKKKINLKQIITLLITFIVTFTSVINVNATSETIQLGDAPYVNERYIANVGFFHKQTTSGEELYCLNISKATAKNTTATLVRNSKYVDGGIVYILKNGYPNKSITGNNDKDYYITQTAVWWYLDEIHGSQNLGEQFKKYGSETTNGKGMREIIKKLVNEAIQHRNDSTNTTSELSLSSDTTMTLTDGYYISNSIKAEKASNISSYKITISGAPTGTKIIKNGEAEIDYSQGLELSASDTFKVKVPASSVTDTTANITITATASGATSYAAYEYQPTNTNMQNVALLEKTPQNVTSTIKLTISSSKVVVIKMDQDTKQPLAGAKLVLKDSNGNIITSWTTTTSAHVIRNLANGTYTIEEESAPTGYIKSNQPISFTIDDEHKSHQVNFLNTKEITVPNTASASSVIITILGIVILISGVAYVYKTRKNA